MVFEFPSFVRVATTQSYGGRSAKENLEYLHSLMNGISVKSCVVVAAFACASICVTTESSPVSPGFVVVVM